MSALRRAIALKPAALRRPAPRKAMLATTAAFALAAVAVPALAASVASAAMSASPLAGAASATGMGTAAALAAPGSSPAGADTLAAGKRLFTQGTPACATCHTLRHAGAEGAIGPNLDELGPDAARVEKAVRNGIGVMPPFGGKLSDAEIRQLAEYVAAAARLP